MTFHHVVKLFVDLFVFLLGAGGEDVGRLVVWAVAASVLLLMQRLWVKSSRQKAQSQLKIDGKQLFFLYNASEAVDGGDGTDMLKKFWETYFCCFSYFNMKSEVRSLNRIASLLQNNMTGCIPYRCKLQKRKKIQYNQKYFSYKNKQFKKGIKCIFTKYFTTKCYNKNFLPSVISQLF